MRQQSVITAAGAKVKVTAVAADLAETTEADRVRDVLTTVLLTEALQDLISGPDGRVVGDVEPRRSLSPQTTARAATPTTGWRPFGASEAVSPRRA
ncbi:hypothetical protein [Streptomyces sp. NPDC000878]